MDSLDDILSRKDLDMPPEAIAIKSYVERKFKSTVSVKVQPTNIMITSSSAALANTLRIHTTQIQEAAATTKKLLFRISG